MNTVVEATFENGVLRPATPLRGFTEGQRVTITVEDEAEIDRRERELIQEMDDEGMLVHHPMPTDVPAEFEPIEITGKPLSETILEERR